MMHPKTQNKPKILRGHRQVQGIESFTRLNYKTKRDDHLSLYLCSQEFNNRIYHVWRLCPCLVFHALSSAVLGLLQGEVLTFKIQ